MVCLHDGPARCSSSRCHEVSSVSRGRARTPRSDSARSRCSRRCFEVGRGTIVSRARSSLRQVFRSPTFQLGFKAPRFRSQLGCVCSSAAKRHLANSSQLSGFVFTLCLRFSNSDLQLCGLSDRLKLPLWGIAIFSDRGHLVSRTSRTTGPRAREKPTSQPTQ